MGRHVRQQRATRGLLSTGSRLLFVTLVVCGHHMLAAKGETKEFDWGELGVSLAGSPNKPTYQGVPNNLRILVSPQKRITKNYEFDYSNNSQPISETSYMVPSSGPYVSGTHSAAYSALSASLASLKSRLNSRGSSLTDPSSQSSIYSSGYGGSMLGDTQRISQVSQPTYLSVSNHPEFNPSSYVSAQNNQSTDNKTIVLAIPAKINFLTEKQQQQQQLQLQPQQQQQQQQPQQLQLQPQQQSQQQQQQQLPQQQQQIQIQTQQVQQPQQVTVIQAAPQEQQVRSDYSKQLGLLHGQEGVVGDQPMRDPSQDHEHQYVIVNSAPAASSHGSQEGQLLTTQLTAAAPQQIQAQQVPQTVYSSVYSPGSIAMKYIPANTYQQAAQPVAQIQQSAGQQQQQHTVVAAYEQQLSAMEPSPYGSQPSSSCPDTCNSADIRWRKYTVSKYKSCCSRSSQYDLAQFEHPSLDKLSDNSKQADDAYYNYLYRKSRSSRRRKSRAHPSSRYYRYSGSAASSAASNNNGNSDDMNEQSQGDAQVSGRHSAPSSPRHHTSYYPQDPSPYMKYYAKSRQTGSHEAQEAAHEPLPPTGTGRRGSKSYRRARSRDFDAQSPPASSQDSYDSPADEDEQQSSSVGSSSRGSSSPSPAYGSGDYSVDASGRYPQESRNGNNDEEERGVSYDDQEGESAGKGNSGELAEEGPQGQENEGTSTSNTGDEAGYEPELTSHISNKYSNKRRNKKVNERSRLSSPRKNGKESAKANRGRGRGKGKVSKQEYSSSQKNSTSVYADFDSVSTSDEQNKQPEYSSNSTTSGNNDSEEPQAQQKDSYSSYGNSDNPSSETEKEATSHPSSNKHKSNLNETTVANLSKTTMHLKEILTMLEKKAQMRANDSLLASMTTSTPLPITTTTYYPASLFSSSFSGPSLSGVLSSADYLASSDLAQLKSSYRDSPSLSSSLTLPAALNSLASEALTSAYTPYNPAPYSMSMATKHYPGSVSVGPRKRRVPKPARYNHLMLQKHHGLGGSYQLQHPAAPKSQFLNSAYLQSLQYPYWPYRGHSSPATSSYPYKSTHKNTYSTLMSAAAPLPPKSSGQLYSDESRYHGLTYADPLTSVASSLRPPSTMRLRPKQFMFQPHVLPMYARQSLFSQPLDVKK